MGDGGGLERVDEERRGTCVILSTIKKNRGVPDGEAYLTVKQNCDETRNCFRQVNYTR